MNRPLSPDAIRFVGLFRLLVDRLVDTATGLDDCQAAAFFAEHAVQCRRAIGAGSPELVDFGEVFEAGLVAGAIEARRRVRCTMLLPPPQRQPAPQPGRRPRG